MIAGLSISTLTTIHVVISLIAIVLGLVAFLALARGRFLKGWHDWFLITTIATSATGFFFPFKGITPAMVVGALSLALLVIACVVMYRLKLKGWAKLIYVVTGMLALYFNLFVLVIQSFQKIPSFNALAPTGSEPPFVIVQGVVLIASVILGVAAFFGSRKISIET